MADIVDTAINAGSIETLVAAVKAVVILNPVRRSYSKLPPKSPKSGGLEEQRSRPLPIGFSITI